MLKYQAQLQKSWWVDANKAVLYFDLAGQTSGPGRGAYVDGTIFWNTGLIFDKVTASTDITVNRSIIPVEWHYLGRGNIDADPIFVEPNTDPPWLAWRSQVATGFHLRPSSPAIGAGPCGLDMGAYVPGGAAICGEPDPRFRGDRLAPAQAGVTHRTDAALVVGGPGITHYKYSVNGGLWSQERSVDVPIELTNLLNGQSYTVYAIAKNSAGFWQSEESPSVSRTWTINVSHRQLLINEVLAINISGSGTAILAVFSRAGSPCHNQGTFPDLIELYLDGPDSLSLSGISISDNPDSPMRFVFPAGTTFIKPGQHLVLCADSETTTSGIHLGFTLNGAGQGVYLYDKNGVLLDSVEFGLQLPDLSIGRIGYNGQTSARSRLGGGRSRSRAAEPWHLTIPTFGRPNVAQPLGNLAAFQSIYRTSTNVAGEYSGSLSNGGENIIPKLPWPLEKAILRFEHSDRWYPTTDGGGNSLMIYDPAAHPATWTQPESWQPLQPTPGW